MQMKHVCFANDYEKLHVSGIMELYTKRTKISPYLIKLYREIICTHLVLSDDEILDMVGDTFEAIDLVRLMALIRMMRDLYVASSKGNFFSASKRLEAIDQSYNILRASTCNRIVYPFDPKKRITAIDYKNTKVLSASTYPIQFKFILYTNEVKYVLYKSGCNIMRDVMVLRFIAHIAETFQMQIKTYKVIPLSEADGIVEMISNIDLYTFSKKLCFNNHQNRFVESLAFYLAISHILGIGDRHINNMLFLPDGNIVYIDYSHMLGRDPKYYNDFCLPSELKRIMRRYNLEDYLVGSVCKILISFKINVQEVQSCLLAAYKDTLCDYSIKEVNTYIQTSLMLHIPVKRFKIIIRSKIMNCFDSCIGSVTSLVSSIASCLRL